MFDDTYLNSVCVAQVLLIHASRNELLSSEAMSRTLVFGGRGFVGAVSLLQRRICMFEGSLEVKLLTILTDEKQRWEE